MTAINVLREVKSYMEFWGWTDGGGPGSVKLDIDDHPIAKHGDRTWVADVETACDTIKRIADRLAHGESGDGKS